MKDKITLTRFTRAKKNKKDGIQIDILLFFYVANILRFILCKYVMQML